MPSAMSTRRGWHRLQVFWIVSMGRGERSADRCSSIASNDAGGQLQFTAGWSEEDMTS